ncbi:MAG: ROK family transcriptional regulator [Acidimicrobiia bacterium]|nr:ROK family transcriptional regulator [Acidimicrobiia bacterium]MDX2468355.1 ROK family transcriptional regulator [Acidimicrobiia bacterium]
MPQTPGLRPIGKTHPDETRRNNHRLVLQEIFDSGPLSRADAARSTGLGRATVSDITSDLIGEGLVVEVGLGESTGGKPPTLLELDPDGRFAVAVDLSRHPIEAALVNLRGRIVARAKGKALEPAGQDALEETHRVITELVGEATAPALGIGVGVPGVVDRSGRVVVARQLGWADLSLQDQLEDVYGLPSHVVSDVDSAAVAEFGRTASDPSSRVLYVKVDDRIAVSFISAARLNRTPNRGGDLTHLQVADWEDICSCGRNGCLGTRVSMIEVLGPDYLDMSTEGRSRLAVETAPRVDEAAKHLGAALAPIVAALDVGNVVVGGELAGWPSVPAHVATGIESVAGWSPDVAVSHLGMSAVLLGSAAMVLSGELGVVWG